jgi:plasmid maintenance system killer protein
VSESPPNNKTGKGFAGLDSMASDVSEDIRAAKQVSTVSPTPPEDAGASSSPSDVQPPVQPNPTPASPNSSGMGATGWILGAVVLFLIVAGLSGKKPSSPSAQPTSSQPAPSYPESSAPASPPVASPPAPQSNIEMPPVGSNNVLDVRQIRYCQTENIRIEAIESVVDKRKSGEVERFNALVNDYNSRCGQYRYRRGDLQRVQQEVEQNRSAIANQAKSDWGRSSSAQLDLEASKKHTESSSTVNGLGQKPSESSSKPSLSLNDLSYGEREAIESACSQDKYLNGPSAYNKCLARHLAALKNAPRNIDLSSLSHSERESIESACSQDKYVNGPSHYNRCLTRQLVALKSAPRDIDLSSISYSEKESIEFSCSQDKYINGPAAYNRCLASKLRRLKR